MKTSTTLTAPRLTAPRLAALALAAAGAMALAGCENPQPTAAPEQPTAAPPPGDAALMGAPTARTPQYVGPAAPGYAPPNGYANGYPPPPPPPGPNGYGPPHPPPPPPAGSPPYAATAYPPGYGHSTGPGAPGEIVAMAPIPNPPEAGWYYGHHYGAPAPHPHRHHVWIYGGSTEGYAAPTRRTVHRGVTQAYRPAPPSHAPVAPQGAAPAPTTGVAQLPKPHAPSTRHRHASETTASSAASSSNTVAQAPANATEADRYKALESALHDAFESVAVLNAPSSLPAGQASTVTLTVPAEFAAAVQRDAAQQGLQDAAASMNLLATLSGDGYTVTPVEPQTVALTANAPVIFQWQVTPSSGARGPLKANVRAQAVSAGQYLNLGDKTAGDTMLAGKVVGIGLLVLIAALILGWAFRRKPARPQTVVRRPAYDQYPTVPPRP